MAAHFPLVDRAPSDFLHPLDQRRTRDDAGVAGAQRTGNGSGSVRNVFDQYKQPENRLTHSLATVLHEDAALLKSFLATFGPTPHPPVRELKVIEQSLPGIPELAGSETFSHGLPDAVIFSDEGWALIIESKISDALDRKQLERHRRTIEKCGFDRLFGLAVTVQEPGFNMAGWHVISWKDVYAWAHKNENNSHWAGRLVDYFNVAEGKMTSEEYLKEGTITEFSGISFDPYTYLEGKRVLRLLTQKLRGNAKFIKTMRLDPASGRKSITEQRRIWDFISFLPSEGGSLEVHSKFPHCTVAIGPEEAEAMITFPNGMRSVLRKQLLGASLEDFTGRLEQASHELTASLNELKAYRPKVRLMQRRYPSQSAEPLMDGSIEFDIRAAFGDPKPHFGPPIKKQQQWVQAAYELLANQHSNIQFQIGVEFQYPEFDELADKEADRYFIAAFSALRPFASVIVNADMD